MEQIHQKFARLHREDLRAALALPLPATAEDVGCEGFFSPWGNVIRGIHGDYSSESDDLMIETLEAVRDVMWS